MAETLFSAIDLKDLQEIIAQTIRKEFADLSIPAPIVQAPEPEELLNRTQAAELLGISLVTLYEYTNKGILPAYRFGSRLRYKRAELIACLQRVKAMRANPRQKNLTV
jgi:excisionase family DNA binding protein